MAIDQEPLVSSALRSLTSLRDELQDFVPQTSASLVSYISAIIVAYLILCNSLRFYWVRRLQSKLNFQTRDSLAGMTIEQAQYIARRTVFHEFPFLYEIALRIALLRTYAVKNVAKVLTSYSDLAKNGPAPKRVEDTAILYTCFSQFGPHSEEFLAAVTRMNYLHAPYKKSGKILEEDFLYVLWVSMVDPIKYIGLYDYRPLSDMEKAAFGTLWKHIGDLMGIDYKAVMGRDQWKDGIDFIEDTSKWASDYEDKYMKPFPEVRVLGEILMGMMETAYPAFARPIVRQANLVLMGERMRHAYAVPEPSLFGSFLTYSLLLIRMIFIRFFSFPRFFPVEAVSEKDPTTGRRHQAKYIKEPWYNASTLRSRWGLQAMFTWLFGGLVPGDGGDKHMPEGFLWSDIGPSSTMGRGVEEIKKSGSLAEMRPLTASPFAN